MNRVGLTVAGVVFIVIGLYYGVEWLRFVSGSQVTTAVVERVESMGTGKSGIETDVYYSYRDSQGQLHKGKDNVDGTPPCKKGDVVNVEYLRNNPQVSRLYHNRRWWYSIGFLVAGIIIAFNPFGVRDIIG